MGYAQLVQQNLGMWPTFTTACGVLCGTGCNAICAGMGFLFV